MKSPSTAASMALLLAASLAAPAAVAHPVTVDGAATEWFAREATGDNLGIVARNASLQGEYVWRDAAADTRTDLATPEDVADLTRVRVTGDATGLSFLFVLENGAATTATSPVQIQVAIDADQVSASGQTFFAGFGDTGVAPAAAWEYLVQTQFRAGAQALVLNQSYAAVGAPLVVGVGTGADTVVEFTVPWARLGLSGPPATPLRFTVATFRELAGGNTVDVGGSSVANALDVVSDYNAPRPSAYPNTFAEFTAAGDTTVQYSFDVWFGAAGEPYAPLLVTRYVSQAANDAAGGGDWIAVRNMTPAPLSLAGFRVADEETVGGGEGAVSLPTATLAPGANFVLSASGASYTARFGEPADGEWAASDTTPDLAPYALWATGSITLANAGDEVLVLDRSHTALDVVVFGSGAYAGVTSMSAPAANAAASRNRATQADTDNNATDFTVSTALCADSSTCGACGACFLNVCAPVAAGVSCRGSTGVCDPPETCDGAATTCPTDALAASTVVCRASAGACDPAESCTGSAAACPADVLSASSVVCRASAGACDVAESCTGSSAACPADATLPSTTVCRASAGPCDAQETCPGNGAACPADGFAPSTTVCRPSIGGGCDVAESCTGSGAQCPADVGVANGTACRASAGVCDPAETCNGTSAPCPVDALAPSTTVCRTSAGACDVAETCTGSAAGCPANGFATVGGPCADGMRCNGDETCDGAGACTPGTPVTCAASTDPCRVNACAEAAGGCALGNAIAGTACGDGNTCNGDETCNGSGACSPGTAPADGGALCADAGSDAGSDVVDVADAGDDVVDAGADDVGEDVPDAGASDAGDDVAVADAGDDAAAIDAAATDAGDGGARDAAADVGRDVVDAGVRVDVATGDDVPDAGDEVTTPAADGGCGCRAASQPSPKGGTLGLLAALGAAVAMRRRRRR